MAASVFPGSTVQVATAGALTGDGTASNKLAVNPDGVTTTINGANQLVAAGGTPGGSNTQVQYNHSGALGGISGATTDGTALTLVAPIIGDATGSTLVLSSSALLPLNITSSNEAVEVTIETTHFGGSPSTRLNFNDELGHTRWLIISQFDNFSFYNNNTSQLSLVLDGTTDALTAQGAIKAVGGYKSSDGSTGATGTATAVNTLTIKNGLIVTIA